MKQERTVQVRSTLRRLFPKASPIDPENLRSHLLTLILRVSSLVGFVVCVPSVLLAFRQGLYGLAVTDTLSIAIVFALYRLERIPFFWRASAVCLAYYAVGVGLLVAVGPLSQIYLFGFSIIVVLLFGLRPGLGAVVVSTLSLLAVGLLGRASASMTGPGSTSDPVAWSVIAINFALVDILLTLSVGAVLGAVNAALDEAVAKGVSLDHERNVLITLIDALPHIVFTQDTAGRFVNCNPATLAVLGATDVEDVRGKTVFDFFPPEVAATYRRDDLAVITNGQSVANREENTTNRDGTAICYMTDKVPLRDASGDIVGLIVISRDITQRKNLEGQLRQSQKMDAIGQLAGGVAHDFNNLLTVILSYSELMLEELPLGAPLRENVLEIHGAGTQAADLTRQLLMFSRQQVIRPRVIDTNELLAGVEKMLRRLIGEDIELTLLLEPVAGRVRIDPGSLQQVIVNLVVNARDAMPSGGRITVETANEIIDEDFAKTHLGAEPGEYVRLSVSDTGTGMDRETLARIFEPFFTTKGAGKGTGLGLSTVFGIVQQVGGTVWVYSEPGVGTTFKVYLPRVDVAVDVISPPVAQTTLRGSETVLLVEDEGPVLNVARGILQRHGYTVLEARSAADAIVVSAGHAGTIDLLLTDIVMPGTSGPALAASIAAGRPAMRVLCMSGYTDDAAVRHGFIDGRFAYLQKPFTVASLTGTVRAVLDSANGRVRE